MKLSKKHRTLDKGSDILSQSMANFRMDDELKQVAAEYPERKGTFLLLFTAANVVMLGVLFLIP